jgi:hypothetical protein
MNKGFMASCLRIAALLLVLYWTGCGTATSIYRKVPFVGSHSDLKKRVLLMPIVNQSALDEERVEEMNADLIQRLSMEKDLIVKPGKTQPNPTLAIRRSPLYGVVINQGLVKMADAMGMNVLVATVMNPAEVYTKKTGFWIFKGVKREIEISIVVNAIDVVNGTLFLSNLESKRVKIFSGEEMINFEPVRTLAPEELDKIMSRLFKAQTSAITDNLRAHPWMGKILSVNGDKAVINAGADVGIREGMVFDVFGNGDPIKSFSGRTYYLRGAKEGEVKVEDLSGDRAQVVPLEGSPSLVVGQVIREK